jgi:hypothetical protein
VVCVADQLAKIIVPESRIPQPYPEDHQASFDALGIGAALNQKICEAVSARFAKVLDLFGIA